MNNLVVLLLSLSCLSGYWHFLQTPRPGRMANKITVFVTNKTCTEDFLLSASDDADSINGCKNLCLENKQCTAFTFLSRHNRQIKVNIHLGKG